MAGNTDKTKPGGNTQTTAATTKEATNPFDPSHLRLSQDFATNIGVKKVTNSVPVRRPDRQWFVRTHPSEDMRLETAVIELKDDRETYLVSPEMRNELPGEVAPKMLMAAINRQGTLFLWPIRLPGEDGRHDELERALEVELAMGVGVELPQSRQELAGALLPDLQAHFRLSG